MDRGRYDTGPSADCRGTMRLAELAGDAAERIEGDPGTEIAGLTADSRKAGPGMLFAALPGTKIDGTAFAAAAVAAGAAAVLVPEGAVVEGLGSAAVLRDTDTRRRLALMAARFFGRQPETMVAVTGTAGKTSIASFVRQIWQAAGHASAAVGTLGVTTAAGTRYGSLTTPDPIRLHEILAELAGAGITHAAMEASSHGLDQRRLDGVRLKAAAFTNLGRDHLDYHSDAEDYFRAKLRLFDTLLEPGATVVVDADEPYADRVAAVARARGLTLMTVGEAGSDLRLVSIERDGHRQHLEIEAAGRRHAVLLPLVGRFQVSNALVAAALAIATGVLPEAALGALAGLEGAEGRLDFVGATAEGAPCFVDYAHKPEALEKALAAVRPFADRRLVVVFGAGGDRDRGKRPVMGGIAAAGADVVIVTDDNPRSEEPAAIRAAILGAAPGAMEIGDRREAIRAGVAMLGAGDVLLVAGKGHETGQIVGETVLAFSDHEEVAKALRDREGR